MNRYCRKRHKDNCKLRRELEKTFGVNISYKFAKKFGKVMRRIGNIMFEMNVTELNDINFDAGPIIITGFEITQNNDPDLPYTFGINWILKKPQSFCHDME